MKEQDLIDLGFERTDETMMSSGSAQDWYYYTYNIGIDSYNMFCLITCASDEVVDDEWKVYIFDNNSFEFTSAFSVETLIKLLQYNIKE